MKRSFKKEILDLGEYTSLEYETCLEKLNQIGEELGGDRASLRALKDLKPQKILDVGCGGGFFTAKLAHKYPEASVIGVDISSEAIQYALKQNKLPNLKFIQLHEPKIEGEYDLIVSTLTAHHMSNQEFITFLKQATKASPHVVVNDLHRHWLAYLLYALVAPIRYRNRLITSDGLLSIKRSFTKKDLIELLKQANISKYTIQWHWPFRWTVKIDS